MPNRILRDYTDSLAVDQLDWLGECMFVRLIQKADDYGRFHGNPTLVRSLLFPLKNGLRDSDISARLTACEKAGLIRVYESSGKPFVEIVNFGQRLKASTRSKYPEPPWGNGGQIPEVPGTSRKFPEVPARDEGEGEDEKYLSPGARAHDGDTFHDESETLGELYPKWLQWLEVRDFTHGNGKPIHPLVRSRQLQTLISLPEEVREPALDAAIKGCWKNIQDIRESASGGKTNGRKRVDPRDPATWE